jgi:hypothetical protein
VTRAAWVVVSGETLIPREAAPSASRLREIVRTRRRTNDREAALSPERGDGLTETVGTAVQALGTTTELSSESAL